MTGEEQSNLQKRTIAGPAMGHAQKKNGSWNNDFGYGLIDAHKTLMNTPRR